jgi:hypothetical protein
MPAAGARLQLLFVLLSLVVGALVNPGNFGTIDTVRRLQVARWIRLGQPPVRPDDAGAGLVGRKGILHPPYGIGQSLLLIPFDALVSATLTPELRRIGLEPERQEQIVELTIAFLMQTFLTACLLALAHAVLISFGFTSGVSAAGALALLFGTSCLPYVQAAQESLLLLVLALVTLRAIRGYARTGDTRWALLAGFASSFAILVRLTSALEVGVLGLYAIVPGANRRRFLSGFLPPLAIALLLDRWYQYYRFGELFTTYTGILERQFHPPGAPAKYLFSYPFWKGFLGALFAADKSIFPFDPLLVVLLIVAALKWRSLTRELQTILTWLGLLLVGYLAFYAKYYYFGADVSWGDRYVLMPVQMLSLFAVPILLTYARTFPGWGRCALWAIVVAAILVQAESTAIAPNLEVQQRRAGYAHGALWNRTVNLFQLSRDTEEPGRFAGVPVEWRTLYYFPFQLRFRFPSLARWAIAGWLALLACLPFLILATLRTAKTQIP